MNNPIRVMVEISSVTRALKGTRKRGQRMRVVFPIDPERLFAQNGPATTTELPELAKAA